MTEISEGQPVALITGSGRQRIGNVVACYLADRQYNVALHYHSSEDEAMETRDELRAKGVGCEAYQADVSDDEAVCQMVAKVHDRFGRIDVLATTASVWSPSKLADITAEDLRSNFDINTLGTFFAARAVSTIMVNQPEGGAIITFGDWAIDRPYLDHAAYLLSKGAIPTLTRTLALEFAHLNPKIRVNCIHPGPVMFPPGTSDEEKRLLVDSTVVKDADCPDMVAHAVEFLINNKFITGDCIPIDGGRHMYAPSDQKRWQ